MASIAEQNQPPHEPQALAGHLFLGAPGSCFLVAGGAVSLFATNADQTLARHGVGTVSPGGLLFGAEPSFLGQEGLLAVASPAAAIFPLPGNWRVANPSEPFAAGLAIWLTVLVAGLAQRIDPKPRPDLLVSGAQQVTGDSGRRIGCTEGIAWLHLPESGGHLFGIEPVEGLIPLPAGAWVTLDGAEIVSRLDWQGGLARPDWPAALDRFNTAIAELLPIIRGFTETDEFNRIRSRQAAEQIDGQQALNRFASLLGNRVNMGHEAQGDGLMDVLRIIGSKLRIAIRRPAKSRRAQMDLAPTLDEIARASNIRLQRVTLQGPWWHYEAGAALLGRRLSGEPLALLWDNGYFAVDLSGRKQRIGAREAAGIAPEAQLVFAPHAIKLSFVNLMVSSMVGGAGDVLALLLTIALGSVIAQVLPLATSLVFGVLVPAALQGELLQVGIVIVMIGIAGFAVQLAGDIARNRMTARGDAAIQREIWDRVTTLPLSALRRFSSSDIAARANSAMAVTSGLRQFAFGAAATLGTVCSSLWVIAANSLPLALLAALLVVIHVATGMLAGWLRARGFSQGEQLVGTADSQMMQLINGMTKLRSAAAEERAMMRWSERFAQARSKLVRSRRVMNLYESWLAAYPVLGTAALFGLIHTLSLGPGAIATLPMATVVVCVTAFGLMFATVGAFMRSVLMVWLQKPAWVYARALLDHAPEPMSGLSDPGQLDGDIEFAAVSFEYASGQPVLRAVSFRVAPGEMVAVVGESGSGKSTLARLLLGIERPGAGAVYIDGQDLRSLHPGALRSQIGVVLQDDKLPPGTIVEVVRGVTGATIEQVWEALGKAAIAEEIAAMPLGLHTMLTDAGRTLSGGQVQRLSLARALLSAPSILVLDEATSALDGQTQARAMQAIHALPITRFVIAHRISTIRHAHRILVLEGGSVVESGGYDELMAAKGAFARIAGAQV